MSSRNGNFVQMEWLFPFQPDETEKMEYLQMSSACRAENSSADPRMPFAFEPVKRKFFANWKAPQVGYTFSVKSGRLRT